MHPSSFHCYFAGKETYTSIFSYSSDTSLRVIIYNLVYKTGLIFDQIRVMYKLANKNVVQDRDVYVIAKSAGNLFNVVL